MRFLVIIALLVLTVAADTGLHSARPRWPRLPHEVDTGLHPSRPRWPRLPQGWTSASDDSKVVGGTDAKIEEHPHQIALHRGGRFICGGSILDSRNVLTAAHCVDGYVWRPDLFAVRSGSTTHLTGGQLTNVRQIIKHEGYSSWTLRNDVAIIHLATEIDLNGITQRAIDIACDPSETYTGHMANITGWGTTGNYGGGSVPDILQVGHAPVISNYECNNIPNFNSIHDSMICAGGFGVGACSGDSGGPLVSQIDARLIGVASFVKVTDGKCDASYPTVFARVSYQCGWIGANMQ